MSGEQESFTAFREIKIVIASWIIFGGIYLMLAPWFPALINPNAGSGALHNALVSKVSLTLFGLAFLIPGLGLAYGLIFDKLKIRQVSLFSIGMMVMFVQILGIAQRDSLLPISWLTPSAMGIICIIIWWKIKRHYRGLD